MALKVHATKIANNESIPRNVVPRTQGERGNEMIVIGCGKSQPSTRNMIRQLGVGPFLQRGDQQLLLQRSHDELMDIGQSQLRIVNPVCKSATINRRPTSRVFDQLSDGRQGLLAEASFAEPKILGKSSPGNILSDRRGNGSEPFEVILIPIPHGVTVRIMVIETGGRLATLGKDA